MLLRRRAPGIEPRPADMATGFEHLDPGWISLIQWLNANDVGYVLVGGAAEAIRGHTEARGPLAVVPAPYRRNYARLERALCAAHARLRTDPGVPDGPDTVPVKLTAEKLARGQRWTLRCDGYDLDIEAISRTGDAAPPGPGYQELLYEATRFELAHGLTVEVASPEDIEHYGHVARTGRRPEMRISRGVPVSQQAG